MSCALVLPDNISLPNLKVMYLSSIAFQDGKSIVMLFSRCPVLEELTLQWCECTQPCSIIISLPSLKKLKMWCSLEKSSGHSITFDAPSLECINYTGVLSNDIYFTNLLSSSSSSIKAFIAANQYIHLGKEDLRLVKLLRCLENMVSLTITENTAELLSSAMADDEVSEQLPVFHHLKYLDLSFNVKGCLLKKMLKLFYFIPNLCSIELSKGVDHTIRRAGIKWMPKPLPNCFLSSLKILILGNVVGHFHEFFFMESFLEKVVSLERINIFQPKYTVNKERLRSGVERFSKRLKHGVIIHSPE